MNILFLLDITFYIYLIGILGFYICSNLLISLFIDSLPGKPSHCWDEGVKPTIIIILLIVLFSLFTLFKITLVVPKLGTEAFIIVISSYNDLLFSFRHFKAYFFWYNILSSASLGLLFAWHIFFYLFTLEKETATHSSILAWEIPLTNEPNRATILGVTNLGTT